MLKYIREFCDLCAGSGDEEAVRSAVIRVLEGICGVSWRIDPLGNLIVKKRGANRAPHHLMISAHMDEVSLIVTHVNNDGTLCVAPVGGIDASVVIGRQVLVGAAHRHGVIGAKPVHLLSDEEKKQLPQFHTLMLDIGAKNAQEAQQDAPPGTSVYFMPDFRLLGENRVCSKAIDDRIGCALLLELLEQDAAYDFTAAFLAQEEIGLRGAKTAAFAEAPDFALVLDATTAADLVGAKDDEKVCTLGAGPVISFMDRSTIYDKELVKLAFSLCQQHGIPCQTKSRIVGGNDSGAIHISRGGVRTLSVSLPCRYLHAPSSVADFTDMDYCLELVSLLAKNIMKV
ncbi:MAG: M42 family peptidase [Ruminococcus sp.]|nr:M42 family peptidase [Ruminococcus sp.]